MDHLKDITPVKDGEYYIKLLRPQDVDPIELGETVYSGMYSQPIHSLMFGPVFMPKDASVINQCITDPRKRLDEHLQAARLRRTGMIIFGHYCHGGLLKPRYIGFGLYHRTEHYDRLVGYAEWRMPKHMGDMTDSRLGKKGLLYNIWATYKYLIHRLFELWTIIRFGEHPFVRNKRINALFEHRKTIYDNATVPFHPYKPEYRDNLATMSFDELKKQVYHVDDICYLEIFCVIPEYKGKGLGSILMKHCFDEIPVLETPIESRDGKNKTRGPQQLTLQATEEGRPFYMKHGWTDTHPHEYTTTDGVTIINNRMDIVRS